MVFDALLVCFAYKHLDTSFHGIRNTDIMQIRIICSESIGVIV